MKKGYYLATCSTCIRILKELNIDEKSFELQDIKSNKITKSQIEEMVKLSGSSESLFSRRAMKYKAMGLGSKKLNENDYKNLILEEYTFLKRPVFIINNKIFIGNSKNVVEAVSKEL